MFSWDQTYATSPSPEPQSCHSHFPLMSPEPHKSSTSEPGFIVTQTRAPLSIFRLGIITPWFCPSSSSCPFPSFPDRILQFCFRSLSRTSLLFFISHSLSIVRALLSLHLDQCSCLFPRLPFPNLCPCHSPPCSSLLPGLISKMPP